MKSTSKSPVKLFQEEVLGLQKSRLFLGASWKKTVMLYVAILTHLLCDEDDAAFGDDGRGEDHSKGDEIGKHLAKSKDVDSNIWSENIQ